MAKGGSKKKSKRGRSTRGKPGKPPATEPRLDDVLSQAESAMEMSDVDTALKLFGYAASVLRSRIGRLDENGSMVDMPMPAGGDDSTSSAESARDQRNREDSAVLATVLGKLGELKASNGHVDAARSDFLEAIDLLGPSSELSEGETSILVAQSCESKAGLRLYLGQLSHGNDALQIIRKGVTELQNAVKILEHHCNNSDSLDGDAVMGGSDSENANYKKALFETRRQLCAAHCSTAELYLTDLCEEPDAEDLCEASLKDALAIDDQMASFDGCLPPDALQTMANFRLSQSRGPEALDFIMKAYGRMKTGCEAMSSLVGLRECDGDAEPSRELVEVEAASQLPEYNFRCQTAKIMLECASLQKEGDNDCIEASIQVLGSLLAENDEVADVWLLMGCSFAALSPPNNDAAKYYWETALSMLNTAKEGLEVMIEDDAENECLEQERQSIQCQLEEVKAKLGIEDEDMTET